MNYKDTLIGQIFNNLTVIAQAESKNHKRRWICRCKCGNITDPIATGSLKSGNNKGCGCIKIQHSKELCKQRIKHGMSYTATYKAWKSMKRRCYNEDLDCFKHYGGRGVTVSDRWIESFENFLEDMGERPGPEYSLDRIDVNGNYEPSNCRWATKSQQSYNRRINNKGTSQYRNVCWIESHQKWVASMRVDGKNISLGHYDSEEKAARAVDKAALELRGDDAILNFPDEDYINERD